MSLRKITAFIQAGKEGEEPPEDKSQLVTSTSKGDNATAGIDNKGGKYHCQRPLPGSVDNHQNC